MVFPEVGPLLDPVTPVTDADPKAFWRFENNLLDTATVGPYPLALTAGTETYAVSDNLRNTLSFDNLTYFGATGYKGITGSNPRAISVWVKTTKVAASRIISWGDTGTGEAWSIRTIDSGQIFLNAFGGRNKRWTTGIADDEWHHIAIVLEAGDTDVSDVKLYVDGVLDAPGITNAGAIGTVGTQDVTIGAFPENSTTARLYSGLIDEVAIFDGLTAAEVLAIYKGSQPATSSDLSYKESTDTWVPEVQYKSGGRYKPQLVALSDQGRVYYGDF